MPYAKRKSPMRLHRARGLRRCTHLTLDATLDAPQAALLCEGGVRSAAAALVSSATASFWADRTFTVRPPPAVQLFIAGQLLCHIVLSALLFEATCC